VANSMITETTNGRFQMFAGSFQTIRAFGERLLRLGRRAPRRLRLCESLQLGERRFVAVVEFDAARFLVGGTPSSLVLLSRLPDLWKPPDDENVPVSESAAWDGRHCREKC